MSNWIDIHLDVLASSPEEINRIELALREPCEGLISCRAQMTGEDPRKIAGPIKRIVAFEPIRNLGYVDPSLNRWRRFGNSSKDRFSGLLWRHISFVSEEFPNAVFLAIYRDSMASYAGKRVLYGGKEIRCTRDHDQQAQGLDWILPVIFAPFISEHELGLQVGTLWDKWLEGLEREVAELRRRYGKQEPKVKEDHGV